MDLNGPTQMITGANGIALLDDENIVFTDNGYVYELNLTTGFRKTIAGSGKVDVKGDGSIPPIALNASFKIPGSIAVAGNGEIYFVDSYNYAIRIIDRVKGTIRTLATRKKENFNMGGSSKIMISSRNDLFIFTGSCLIKYNIDDSSVVTLAGPGLTCTNKKQSFCPNDESLKGFTINKTGTEVYLYFDTQIRRINLMNNTCEHLAGKGSKPFDDIKQLGYPLTDVGDLEIDAIGNILFVLQNKSLNRLNISARTIIPELDFRKNSKYSNLYGVSLKGFDDFVINSKGDIVFADKGSSVIGIIRKGTEKFYSVAGTGRAGTGEDKEFLALKSTQIKTKDSLARLPRFDIDSQLPSFKKFDNKYYIVLFWGSWCKPCIDAMNKIGRTLQVDPLNKEVVLVNQYADNGYPERDKKYLLTKKLNYLYYTVDGSKDPQIGNFFDGIKVNNIPVLFVYKNGKRIYQSSGEFNVEELQSYLKQ